ncbi:MAG: V-type ATPase subunit [Clostridiales bacterium]|jgi:V/A-type H+-transporting ATPase subunit C|nr:V-type ATPase subunit [Clostridiales bacterium]
MSVASAQAVNAKCRAMYSKLLGRADYDALLAMRSVPQIAEYLKKETPYAYVLRRLGENEAHRGQLEQLFKKSLYYDYEKLLLFSTGDYKAGIQAMFESYEIDDLKLVIGSICSDHESYLSPDDLTYVRHYSEFGAAGLLECGTMEELAEFLKGTRYYRALKPFAVRERPDFLKIDSALNQLDYAAKMGAFRDKLGPASSKLAVSLYGEESDIGNILFIYRAKKLYRLPVADMLVSLVPSARLSNRELLALAESRSLQELIALAAKSCYGHLFPAGREREWESVHEEHFYAIHRRNLRAHGNDIGVAMAYFFLKRMDIKNIITIIEGVRYALPTRDIAAFLIGYGARAAAAAG